MSNERDALATVVAKLQRQVDQRRKLGIALLAGSAVFLGVLVALEWHSAQVFGRFDREFLERMTAQPETLPDALLLTHAMSALSAKRYLTAVMVAGAIGGFFGAGLAYLSGRKGVTDLVLDLWHRVEALEQRRVDEGEST